MSSIDEVPIGVLDRLGLDERVELVVVGVLAGDGFGEDGGVRCHPPDAFFDEIGQRAVLEPVAAQVVEPWALLLLLVEIGECGHDAPFLPA